VNGCMLPWFYGVQGYAYAVFCPHSSPFRISHRFTSCVSRPTRGERPRPHDGGVQERLVSILIPAVPRAPFSATVSTESIRMLADGSRITLVNHRAIARDGAGRIFQERRLLVPPDGEHESVITQTEISTPLRTSFISANPMNTSANWSLILLRSLRELPAPSI
jgi:hypothetical protein